MNTVNSSLALDRKPAGRPWVSQSPLSPSKRMVIINSFHKCCFKKMQGLVQVAKNDSKALRNDSNKLMSGDTQERWKEKTLSCF